MYKKYIVACIFLLFFIVAPGHIFAQNSVSTDTPVEDTRVVEAFISSEDIVQVGKKIIFGASNSIVPEDNTIAPSYRWDFGDGFFEVGEEVVHQYGHVGTYDVTLSLSYDGTVYKASKSVFVYDTRALLIIDTQKQDDINLITRQAQEQGVALKVLSPEGFEGDFFNEDSLVKLIGEQASYIKDSSLLLFYTKSLRGLQAFTSYWQGLDDETKGLIQKKFFVVITDGNIDVASHGVFQSYQIILPPYILLTRPEALNPILGLKNLGDVEAELLGRGIEFIHIDENNGKSPFYILSQLITYFIERGISPDSVYLILALPFLAFIVIFCRHVIGISTFGVYTPVIITVAFYMLGLWFGLFSFLFAVITSYAVKYIFDRFELLYLPKVALNLSFIALSFLLLILLMLWLGTPVSLSVAVFPMLVMSTLSEKFMTAKSEEGLRNAILGVIETLVVVIGSYYLMLWASFNNLVISWPEVVLLPLVGILLLGKFSGLRVSEYFRFRSLFSEHTEE
ncbi:MAG TPA: hypothetical protein DCS29_03505 [Candidatus Magasanikbacteria bacterium]|nr:MAG: hypothetical protein A2479_04305 [Candidatus Magasanikbacteria bacterium RIFOXYC2_FULL_39_8]HAT03808.1 hypothetical protein [Candidatus Magasanikbacteria bacterium]